MVEIAEQLYTDSEGLGEDHKEYQHLISNKAKKLWSVFKELEEKFGEWVITEAKKKVSLRESFKERAIYNIKCKINPQKSSMYKSEEDYEVGLV